MMRETETANFEELLRGKLGHTRSCPALTPGDDEDCTCGLIWRVRLQTEMTMHNAWRKRAEEAESGEQAAPGLRSEDESDDTGLREAAEALLDELEALIESHGVAVPSRKAINRLRAALAALPSPLADVQRCLHGKSQDEHCEQCVIDSEADDSAPTPVKDAPLSADRQETPRCRWCGMAAGDTEGSDYKHEDYCKKNQRFQPAAAPDMPSEGK